MLALAVVLAVFMITVGGFEYMLSGAADTKSDAKKKIWDAVWGLLLALVAYLLLYTIDPNLVSPSNLCIPPIGQTTCTGTTGSGQFVGGGGSFGGTGAGGSW
jgi:RsiW-degrading membrane proteinase PrsW (M82 family)